MTHTDLRADRARLLRKALRHLELASHVVGLPAYRELHQGCARKLVSQARELTRALHPETLH